MWSRGLCGWKDGRSGGGVEVRHRGFTFSVGGADLGESISMLVMVIGVGVENVKDL